MGIYLRNDLRVEKLGDIAGRTLYRIFNLVNVPPCQILERFEIICVGCIKRVAVQVHAGKSN